MSVQVGRAVRLPDARDVRAATLVAVVVLVGTVMLGLVRAGGGVPALTVVAVVAAAGAWAWHRVAPVASTGLVVAIVALHVLAGGPFGPIQILVPLACFTLARYRAARTAGLVATVAAPLLAGVLWTRLDERHTEAAAALLVAWPTVFVVLPVLAGALARTRAEVVARERAALVARGAYEERLRMAREVHDIAGHGFAVVAMQAGVALTVFDEQPAQAMRSLQAIRTSSEHALHELQVALDAMDHDALTVGAVPGLVQRVRAAGLPVELTVTGDPGSLDPEVSTTVYRVVQEALTNVVRHAGPTSGEVVVDYRPQEVAVTVRDTGGGAGITDPAQSSSAGRGLRGLHERVETLHGRFRAADRPAGGFEVTATIPNGRPSR